VALASFDSDLRFRLEKRPRPARGFLLRGARRRPPITPR
jgi:hypothetical protein